MSQVRGNHYDVLTLKPGASPEQVEKAYRLCMALYREAGGDDAVRTARERVELAYEVLHDADRRDEYDRANGFPLAPRRIPAEPGVPRPVFAGLREPKVKAPPPPPRPSLPESLAAVPRAEGLLPAVGTGPELKRIRESRGVKLEDIASVTKVSRRILEDIENERHDRLPAPVYVRSFLLQYAKLVGIEPRGTAEAYMARIPRRS